MDINLGFLIGYAKIANHSKTVFGISFLAWVVKFKQKTINHPDFPDGLFMPNFVQISLILFQLGTLF